MDGARLARAAVAGVRRRAGVGTSNTAPMVMVAVGNEEVGVMSADHARLLYRNWSEESFLPVNDYNTGRQSRNWSEDKEFASALRRSKVLYKRRPTVPRAR